MLEIPNRMGIPESGNSGIDTLELCFDKKHYLSYPKDISYRYNSRGFRDNEWPEDLTDVIWCVGDSFTVGIGQPFQETWPQVLEKKTGQRCLNLGEDACSNDTISLRIQEICKLHNPKLIVVMWSYLHRRRVKKADGTFWNAHHDQNDFGLDRDMENFSNNFQAVNKLPTNVINLLIPDAFDGDVKPIREKYKNIILTRKLYYARDHHHFDVKTSNILSQLIIKQINEFDKTPKYPI